MDTGVATSPHVFILQDKTWPLLALTTTDKTTTARIFHCCHSRVFITYIKRHATDTDVNGGPIGRGIVLVAVILLQTK